MINHGQSLTDYYNRLNSFLRGPMTRNALSAMKLSPIERRMLEDVSKVEGLSNRIKFEQKPDGQLVVSVGRRQFHGEGMLNDASEYLRESGLRSYERFSSKTPPSMRFNAGGGYYSNAFMDALQRAHPGKEIIFERESLKPSSIRHFRNEYVNKAGKSIGVMNFSGEESGMSVIMASVGGRNLTEEELMEAFAGKEGFLKISDYNGKTAKRMNAIVAETRHGQDMNRSLKVGLISDQKFYEGLSRGSPAQRAIAASMQNPYARERSLDGAVVLSNKTVQDLVSYHEDHIQSLRNQKEDMARGVTGREATALVGPIEDQISRTKNIVAELERLAKKGGRASTFRAMGLSIEDLGGLDADPGKNFTEALLKGDAIVLPKGRSVKGKAGQTGFELLVDEYVKMSKLLGHTMTKEQIASLKDADVLAFSKETTKKNLGVTTEIGYKVGQNGRLVIAPLHGGQSVMTNVENITATPLLTKIKGEGFAELTRKTYMARLQEVERTGTIPVGYIRDMIKVLDQEEARIMRTGSASDIDRIRAKKARASRLLDSVMSGGTATDPIMVKEFVNSIKGEIQRSKGKIDPLFRMPSSVFAHVASTATSLPSAKHGESLEERIANRMTRVADDYMAYSKEHGFIFNQKTAAKVAYQFGGYDFDDALEAHLRWGLGKEGQVQLFALTTRTPLAGGEGGVFKVAGFGQNEEMVDTLEFLKVALRDKPEALEELQKFQKLNTYLEMGSEGKEATRLRKAFENRFDQSFEDYMGGVFGDAEPSREGKFLEYFNQMIKNNVEEMSTLSGKNFDEFNLTPYEYAKKEMDRTLSNQIQYLDKSNPIRKAYDEGNFTKLIGHLADAGSLDGREFYRPDGSYDTDAIERLVRNKDMLEDVLNTRVLRHENMASFESWIKALDKNTHTGKLFAEATPDLFNDIYDSKDMQVIKEMFEELKGTALEDKSLTASMIRQYELSMRSNGLLGRSINANVVLDAMTSSIRGMTEAGLISKEDALRLAGKSTFIEPEVLIDTMVQGGLNEKTLTRLNKIYASQVASVFSLMGGLDELIGMAAANTSDMTKDEIKTKYGLSAELFEDRVGRGVFRNTESGISKIAFAAMEDAFGEFSDPSGGPDIVPPENLAQFRNVMHGRNVFGRGDFGELVDVTKQLTKDLDTKMYEMLRGNPVIKELAGEIFDNEELDAADYLQQVFEEAREKNVIEIEKAFREGTAPADIAENILGLDHAPREAVDRLASKYAQRDFLTAFAENFAEYEEVSRGGEKVMALNDKAMRILASFIANSGNTTVINSSMFAPFLAGVSARFSKNQGSIQDMVDFGVGSFNKLAKVEQDNILKAIQDVSEKKKNVDPQKVLEEKLQALAEERERSKFIEKELIDDEILPQNQRLHALMPFQDFRNGSNGEILEELGMRANVSAYARLTKDRFNDILDMPYVKKPALAMAGLIGASFLYKASSKREEEMLGDSLPGGGSYSSPIPTTQLDIANQYVPQASSGVTYNVNVRGGGSDIRSVLESIAGTSSSGSIYNSLPRPSGARSDFRDIEGMF